MRSENQVILLVGSDPDVLFLRSAVLASAGVWSLRVRNADQAIEVLGRVACDLVVICYTLNKDDQHQLSRFLLIANSGLKVLWMVPGDDCSGTGFLMKVQDALGETTNFPSAIMEPSPVYSRMVR
jgi:DNA-binding NtrC family response regulator